MSIVMSMMASYFAFLCFLVIVLFPSSCHLWICSVTLKTCCGLLIIRFTYGIFPGMICHRELGVSMEYSRIFFL